MTVDVARLETLEANARPGPWEVVADQAGEFYGAEDDCDLWSQGVAITDGPAEDGGPRLGAMDRADAEFIAAVRNAAPALFAAHRQREAALALCDEYRANCDPTSTQAQVAEIFRAAIGGVE